MHLFGKDTFLGLDRIKLGKIKHQDLRRFSFSTQNTGVFGEHGDTIKGTTRVQRICRYL
jgi:hypothetical protein